MLVDHPSYLDHLGCIYCQLEVFPAQKINIYDDYFCININIALYLTFSTPGKICSYIL